MHIRSIAYFVTLAREGHFGRAAELCRVSQPTLSAGIAALESELGKRLVIRDRRYVGLTAEGETMLPWARAMLAAHDGMAKAIAASAGPLRGELRLGAIPASMPVTGHVTRAFLRAHPSVNVRITTRTSREIEAELAAFELDAGLTYLDHEPPANTVSVPLYREQYVLLARAGSPLGRAGKAVRWAEVAGQPLCLLHQGMQNRRILDSRLAERGIVLEPAMLADSYLALLAMVEAGDFVSIIPDSYAALLPGLDWARIVPFDDPIAPSRIGLVVSRHDPLGPVAAALLALAPRLELPPAFQPV